MEVYYSLEIWTCDPSKYTINHPDVIVSNFMGESIGQHRVKIDLLFSSYVKV